MKTELAIIGHSNFDIIVASSRENNHLLHYKFKFHNLFKLEKINYSVFIYNMNCAFVHATKLCNKRKHAR